MNCSVVYKKMKQARKQNQPVFRRKLMREARYAVAKTLSKVGINELLRDI